MITSPPLLKGMYRSWIPAARSKMRLHIWSSCPVAVPPMVIAPGRCFAAATTSSIVLNGESAFTTINYDSTYYPATGPGSVIITPLNKNTTLQALEAKLSALYPTKTLVLPVPAGKFASETPTPVTLVPRFSPFRFLRSVQLNFSAPRSRASRGTALSRRTSMTPRVPREDCNLIEV